MQKLLIIFLFALTIGVRADTNKITASITITNATFNGFTFTVNGDTRTFTNNVVNSATQVFTNADATGCGSKTNLLQQIYSTPFAQTRTVDTGSNSLDLVGNANLAMAVTVTAGYASVSYTTQTVALLIALEGPVSAFPTAAGRTNIASDTVGAINAPENTNAISTGSVAASLIMAAISNKTDINGGATTNQFAKSMTASNLTANGTSVIAGTSRWFTTNGLGAFFPLFFDWNSSGSDAGVLNHSSSVWSFAHTNSSGSSGFLAMNYDGLTKNANVASTSANLANIGFQWLLYSYTGSQLAFMQLNTNGLWATNFMGEGSGLYDTTATNLTGPGLILSTNIAFGVMLDPANQSRTNGVFCGTNNFPANSDIAFAEKSITTLTSGGNADLQIGTNENIFVSGPSGAFTIYGIANGRAGKIISIENKTGHSMTLADQSGLETTPANRIRTGSGTDRVNANNPGIVTLKYCGADGFWDVQGSND